jgi:hypothetical protein
MHNRRESLILILIDDNHFKIMECLYQQRVEQAIQFSGTAHGGQYQ